MPKPDLSEFAAVAPAGNPNCCWFRKLTDEQRAKVVAAHEAGYSWRVIAQVVSSWGVVKITRSPVGNHFSTGHTCV